MEKFTIEEKRNVIKEFIETVENLLKLDDALLDEITDAECVLSFITTTGQVKSIMDFLTNRK